MARRTVHAQEKYFQISSKHVRLINDISDKAYRSTLSREKKKQLLIEVLNRSELKLLSKPFQDTLYKMYFFTSGQLSKEN